MTSRLCSAVLLMLFVGSGFATTLTLTMPGNYGDGSPLPPNVRFAALIYRTNTDPPQAEGAMVGYPLETVTTTLLETYGCWYAIAVDPATHLISAPSETKCKPRPGRCSNCHDGIL